MSNNKPQRFAHPFFTSTPPDQRTEVEGFGTRLTDSIKKELLPIPPPRQPAEMTLSTIVNADEAARIEASGSITFHATGDSGNPHGHEPAMVSEAMAGDYDVSDPATAPAFLFHLGDVIYYDNTTKGYSAQFYKPYKVYPGKIIAIPGNHDGEVFDYKKNPDGSYQSTGQTSPCEAFIENFCQDNANVPKTGSAIIRQMVGQPGVYWWLQCPFVDIIGLYSNMAENPGYIVAPKANSDDWDTSQKDWLQATLSTISAGRRDKPAEKKALIIATHHPPFSTGAHSSSSEMLGDIKEACTNAQIMPDAFLSAHSHNYQRYTWYQTFNGRDMEIPFVVCGGGGRPSESVQPATTTRTGDHSYDKSVRTYGYLKIAVDPSKLRIQFFQVISDSEKQVFDDISVDLATNKMMAH